MRNERLFGVTAEEAKKYFLEGRNYFTVPLPEYFEFGILLKEIDRKFRDYAATHGATETTLEMIMNPELSLAQAEGVNYRLTASKDGWNAWRTFHLMHPAVYVRLVQIITKPENWMRLTERLHLFAMPEVVRCTSLMPGVDTQRSVTPAGILKWWNGMERGAIRLALDYDYMMETDILECYDSMDVDFVARAVGGEMGREIAEIIAASEGGRRIGIPQGSALIDLIAEVAFGYIDAKFARAVQKRCPRADYKILRYRDDFRIFTKDKSTAEQLTRVLGDVLAKERLKLNSAKTILHEDIIAAARKADKKAWLTRGVDYNWGILKILLSIYEFAREYPNSGSVQRALIELYEKRIFAIEKKPRDVEQMISVVVNLMAFNPRASMICVAILSKLLSFNPDTSRSEVAEKVMAKAGALPHTEHLEVCLQRLTARSKTGKKYNSRLAQALYDSSVKIWNSDWVSGIRVRDQVVMQRELLKKIPYVVPLEEASAFYGYSDGEMEDEFEEFSTGVEELCKMEK